MPETLQDLTPEDVAAIFLRDLPRSSMVRRRLSQVQATGDNRVFTPLDVLAERYMVCIGLLQGIVTGQDFIGDPPPLEVATRFVYRALKAAPYLWTDRIAREARATEVPSHVIPKSLLPEPRMWWTSNSAFGLLDETGAEIAVIDTILITDEGPGVTVWQSGADSIHGSRPYFGAWSLEYGQRFPEDFTPGSERNSVGQLLGALAFLKSPYVPKSRRGPTRSERREAARGGDAVEDVTFVDLRRVAATVGGEGAARDVHWRHQWIVRGHLRAQWYPSERAHHVIYVPPYVKGPEGAPLLEHVNRVKR